MEKSWEAHQEAFDKLLSWLDSDRENAGAKYETIRMRLIKILAYRGCFEAEDLADQTIDRVVKKIDSLIDTYEGDPAYYFLGVANNVYREFLKKPRLEELPEQIPDKVIDIEEQPEYDCLENCLQKLPAEHRRMVIEYYRDERSAKIDNRKKLAESAGLTIGALHVKVFRLRAGLQKCVHKCVEE